MHDHIPIVEQEPAFLSLSLHAAGVCGSCIKTERLRLMPPILQRGEEYQQALDLAHRVGGHDTARAAGPTLAGLAFDILELVSHGSGNDTARAAAQLAAGGGGGRGAAGRPFWKRTDFTRALATRATDER